MVQDPRAGSEEVGEDGLAPLKTVALGRWGGVSAPPRPFAKAVAAVLASTAPAPIATILAIFCFHVVCGG